MARVTTRQDGVVVGDAGEIKEHEEASSLLGRVVEFLRGPYPTLVSRLVLGGIMFLAGLSKLGYPAPFAANINSYQVPLPEGLVQIMAVGLPPLEMGLGIWLLVGLFTRFSAAVSGVLMVIFTVAITQAWLRGLSIDCGCFAGENSNPLGTALLAALGPIGTYLTNDRAGPESIARDLVFLAMAVHLMFVPTIFAVDNWRRRRALAEDNTEDEAMEEEFAKG